MNKKDLANRMLLDVYDADLGQDQRINFISNCIKMGADLNCKNDDGWTTLHEAVNTKEPEPKVVNFLIKSGANVEVKNNQGSTPLHIAAWRGNGEIIDILLKAGANKNIKNKYGKIPLIYAAENTENTDTILEMLGGIVLISRDKKNSIMERNNQGNKKDDKKVVIARDLSDKIESEIAYELDVNLYVPMCKEINNWEKQYNIQLTHNLGFMKENLKQRIHEIIKKVIVGE